MTKKTSGLNQALYQFHYLSLEVCIKILYLRTVHTHTAVMSVMKKYEEMTWRTRYYDQG